MFDKLKSKIGVGKERKTEWDSLAENTNYRTEVSSYGNAPNPNLRPAEFSKAQGELRQQRKIVGALLSENSDVIGAKDVAIGPSSFGEYYDKINSGEIGKAEEDKLLARIAGPVDFIGYESVSNNIRANRQTSVIMDWMIGGKGNPDNVDQDQIRKFLDKYPSPSDFEAQGDRFLKMVAENNNDTVLQMYQQSMDMFKTRIYGKKQEYYSQMKKLRQVAELRDSEYGKTQKLPTIQKSEGNRGVESFRGVSERRGELLARDFGSSNISKAQVRMMKNGMSPEIRDFNDDSEDCPLLIPESQMYGVFDGAGGIQGGREASRAAVNSIWQMKDSNIRGGNDLAEILNAANIAVSENPSAGVTTAVLTKIIGANDGSKKLAFASVGDSRIYVVRPDGSVEQLTHDEGFENKITNALGMGVDRGKIVRQYGEFSLVKGDRVVLCSDGVTGDKGTDLMSPQEVSYLVRSQAKARDAARALTFKARKTDDRTAIVFDV